MSTNQKITSTRRQREQDQKDRAAERVNRRADRKVRAAARRASGLVGPQIAEPVAPEGDELDPNAPVSVSGTDEVRPRSVERPQSTVKRLYVGNLSFDTDAEAIRTLFAQHGEVSDVHVVLDQVTRSPRGFAFVTMGSPAEAQGAIDKLDGQTVDGRPLRVSQAEGREPRAGGMSSGGRRR
jgi:RNA recognition motif-containing protein